MHTVLKLPQEHEKTLSSWVRATPLEALGPLFQEQVILGSQTFAMWRPAEPDRLLEHPATLEAFGQDEYMPYWCDLWPASRMLAKAILGAEWDKGVTALEIGCGLGMAGVAALSKEMNVVFSDYDGTALRFAAANALHHGYEHFELLPMNWGTPPERQFTFIVGADLLYETRCVPPVIDLLKKMLAPGGMAWITDQDRSPSGLFRQMLKEQGFNFTTQFLHAGQPAGPGQIARRVKGTLYQIKKI